jgi:hypothetical protein
VDNDQDGRDHAVQVYATLLPVVLTVKRYDFTDLPKGGDVSDWLDTGHTADDLVFLLTQTSVITAEDLGTTDAATPTTSLSLVSALDPGQAERFQKALSTCWPTYPALDQYGIITPVMQAT